MDFYVQINPNLISKLFKSSKKVIYDLYPNFLRKNKIKKDKLSVNKNVKYESKTKN